MGKSTFAWEFCRRWERGELAQQYQLVLLLRLRDERMSRANSLDDLIYHPLQGVCEAVSAELVLSHGLNTLIVLEGFDELPDSCRERQSIFCQLMAGTVLPLATILVTSRPWATQAIHRYYEGHIYQHIEILGFASHQINEYIESTLPQDKARGLSAQLDKYPQLRMGMYIPLNCAIVVTVFQECQARGLALPSTLTGLYTASTKTLLLRYLHDHSEYKNVNLQMFNDLPPPVHTKFTELCALAYGGIVTSSNHVQLIFSGLPSDFDTLGFMDSVTELYVTQGMVSSHNFLHLTFQEFLAAIHISAMSPAKQLEHFKKHKDGRLTVVLRFLAGLNKMDCFTKENFSDFYVYPNRTIYDYMATDFLVTRDLVNWMFEAQSSSVIALLLEDKTVRFSGKNDINPTLTPLDYYFLGYCIAHSQCQWDITCGHGGQQIDKEHVRMFQSGVSTSQEATGRVVRLSGPWYSVCSYMTLSISAEALILLFTECSGVLHLQELHLRVPEGCNITWPDLSALKVLQLEVSGWSHWKLDTHFALESLSISPGCNDAGLAFENCMAISDHIISTKILKQLSFGYRTVFSVIDDAVCIDDIGLTVITTALADNHLIPLEKLRLAVRCTFTDTAAHCLAQFIRNTTTLQTFGIGQCTFTVHGLLELATALHCHPTLEISMWDLECTVTGDQEVTDFIQLLSFDIDWEYGGVFSSITGITYAGIEALAEALCHNVILERLYLSENNIGDSALANTLHHNSTLSTLDLSNNSVGDAGALALAPVLYYNSTLEDLDLSNSSVGDAGAKVLTHALYYNSNLSTLHLSNNSVSDPGAVALAWALHHNSTLSELYLSNNNVSDPGAAALTRALHHNSTLMLLNLSNNNVGDSGSVVLAQALYCNSTLRQLYLSNNNVSDPGAVALAKALHYNSTLGQLCLSYNSVGDAGATLLAQALHHNSDSKLETLCLSNNSVGDDGAVYLAQALHHNSTLSKLNLSNNTVGDAGAVALAQALHHNSTLSKLYLSNNSVGDAGEVALNRVANVALRQVPHRQLDIYLH